MEKRAMKRENKKTQGKKSIENHSKTVAYEPEVNSRLMFGLDLTVVNS